MSIEYATPTKQIRRIKQDDPDFIITDDWAQYPRASFEIARNCPPQYVELIHQAYREGWIKLSAVMYDHELVWEKLSR